MTLIAVYEALLGPFSCFFFQCFYVFFLSCHRAGWLAGCVCFVCVLCVSDWWLYVCLVLSIYVLSVRLVGCSPDRLFSWLSLLSVGLLACLSDCQSDCLTVLTVLIVLTLDCLVVCLFVGLACLPVCRLVCSAVCLYACLRLSACLFVRCSVCLSTYLSVYLSVFLSHGYQGEGCSGVAAFFVLYDDFFG